jgi:5-methylcytosine-specific restriction enzyme A
MPRPRKAKLPLSPTRLATFDSRRVIPAEPAGNPKDHYKTAAHQEWRARVLRRAGNRCEGCGRGPGVPLQADHIVELSDGGDPLALSNGQALCGSCHTAKTHSEKKARLLRP